MEEMYGTDGKDGKDGKERKAAPHPERAKRTRDLLTQFLELAASSLANLP
jgi:hypothetical protein